MGSLLGSRHPLSLGVTFGSRPGVGVSNPVNTWFREFCFFTAGGLTAALRMTFRHPAHTRERVGTDHGRRIVFCENIFSVAHKSCPTRTFGIGAHPCLPPTHAARRPRTPYAVSTGRCSASRSVAPRQGRGPRRRPCPQVRHWRRHKTPGSARKAACSHAYMRRTDLYARGNNETQNTTAPYDCLLCANGEGGGG